MGVTTREVYTVYNRASSTVLFCDRNSKIRGLQGWLSGVNYRPDSTAEANPRVNPTRPATMSTIT